MALDDFVKPPASAVVIEPTRLISRVWFQFLTALWRRGFWTPVSFDAALYTASGAMTWTVESADQATLAYALLGKTLVVSLVLANTTVAGTPSTELRVAIPASLTAARAMAMPVRIRDNGTWTTGEASVSADGTVIAIVRTDGAAFSASSNATDVRGQIAFEVKG